MNQDKNNTDPFQRAKDIRAGKLDDEMPMYDECAMWDDEDCDCEPIGSCDECESDLYEDDVYFYRGLRLCGLCFWLAKGGPGR